MARREIITVRCNPMSLVFQNIDPPPPSPPGECVPPPPPTKAGVTHSPGEEGVGGQYFGRRERQYCPLTVIISLRYGYLQGCRENQNDVLLSLQTNYFHEMF